MITMKRNISIKERLISIDIWHMGIIFFLISFMGWCFEKLGRYIIYNSVTDRGFLSMPFCPIYSVSVLVIYFIIGSPRSPMISLRSKNESGGKGIACVNFLIYFLLVSLVASLVELITGVFFNEAMGVMLWSYEDRFMNIGGYICVGYSLLWGALISVFMYFLWDGIRRRVEKIKLGVAKLISIALYSLLLFDFTFNVIYLLKNGIHFNFL